MVGSASRGGRVPVEVVGGGPVLGQRRQRGRVEAHRHDGAAAVAIGKLDNTQVLLDDLLDDGQAQPGAAGAGGHIRLDDPLAVERQADPVVLDRDDDAHALAADADADRAALALALSPGLNRLDAVLDDVGERLPNLPPVADKLGRRDVMVELEADAGMRNLVEKQRLADDVDERLAPEYRLGHAREGRELVHHPAQITDLPDDRLGQAREGRVALLHLAAVAPLEAFGGELNGGERILDLVRDAPRDVGPGGAALVGELLGDVVEGDDGTGGRAGDTHRQRARVEAVADLDHAVALAFLDQGVELGRHLAERFADQLVGPEQRARRTVRDLDRPAGRGRDHARRHARHHRLDQGAAVFELAVGGDERGVLPFELVRHLVEHARERADLVAAARVGDAGGQVARGDATRRADQLADGRDEAISDLERDPHRQPDDQQRDDQERGVELELQAARAGQQGAVIGDHRIGARRLPRHQLGVPDARGVQEQLGRAGNRGDRLDAVAGDGDDASLAVPDARDRCRRDPLGELRFVGIDERERTQFAPRRYGEERRFGQAAIIDLLDEEGREVGAVDRLAAQLHAHVVGHRQRRLAPALELLQVRRAREPGSVLQHPARAVGIPELDAVLEQQRGDDGDQEHRHRRHRRKQRHEADVQATGAADGGRRGPAARDAAPEQHHQEHARDEVRDEQRRDQERGEQPVRPERLGQRKVAGGRSRRGRRQHRKFDGRGHAETAGRIVMIGGEGRGGVHRPGLSASPVAGKPQSAAKSTCVGAAGRRRDPQIEQALAQRIAVDPHRPRRADLVAAVPREHELDQRTLDLAQDAVVHG